MGVKKGRFGRLKIQFSSKVAKFVGKIGIEQTLIFCTNDFFVRFLVLWYDRFCIFPFVMHSGLSRNLKKKTRFIVLIDDAIFIDGIII